MANELTIKEHGHELTRQKFWNAIKVRYNWPLDRIPSPYICGASFDVTHALSYKKGGFITLRHNEVRDITSELLDEVYVDARKEPILQEVNNEDLPREANKSKEARLDISSLNFWTTGQPAFSGRKSTNKSTRVPKPLTIITKRSIWDVAAALAPPLKCTYYSLHSET